MLVDPPKVSNNVEGYPTFKFLTQYCNNRSSNQTERILCLKDLLYPSKKRTIKLCLTSLNSSLKSNKYPGRLKNMN